MQEGDQVRHSTMPQLGFGEIIGVNLDGTFRVRFRTCTCSALLPSSLIGKSVSDYFEEHGIKCLWHITHKHNISSILQYGILNHYDAYRLNKTRFDISDPDVQKLRERVESIYHRKVHDYVPLYLVPRNPMLRVRKDLQHDLCLVEVLFSALSETQWIISDGNAASLGTLFYNSLAAMDHLPWEVLNAGNWSALPDGKRKRCAEVLIYPKVAPNHIGAIHCYSEETLSFLSNCGKDTKMSRNMFF